MHIWFTKYSKKDLALMLALTLLYVFLIKITFSLYTQGEVAM